MKQEALELLKRCYENSQEPVLLMDENWNVVWDIHNPGFGYLPPLLRVHPNSWESCQKTLHFGKQRWECSLICNQQDEVRIAMLHCPEKKAVPIDTEVISSALTSVNAACACLHDLGPECLEPVRIITGSCMKIYRMTYLQRELERQEAGFWRREPVAVRNLLISVKENIEAVLGDLVDVELDNCDGDVCLETDMDAFAATLLSMVALCYRVPEKRQKLEISADQSERKLILTVSMSPTPEDRRNLDSILSGFGGTEGEQLLLDAFCKEYDGHWVQNTIQDTVSYRITLDAAEPSGILTFNSELKSMEGRFFNKYQALLARIHFRGIF